MGKQWNLVWEFTEILFDYLDFTLWESVAFVFFRFLLKFYKYLL